MTIQSPPKLDLSKYIETRLYGARPHIRGRRVLVSFVASNYEENHLSVARLAAEYTLTEAEVLAALLYYAEHKAVIDAQDAEERTLFDRMHGYSGEERSE
jgi:uncharacterized protein (DUF433 family)